MIGLMLLLAVVGFLLWLLITYVPMAAPIKNVIVVVVVICLILYLLSVFGVTDVPVPHLR
jgi:hypothetical protein